jgi:hypothetical protein
MLNHNSIEGEPKMRDIILFSIIGVLGASCLAATFIVDPSGNGDFFKIQDAINAAAYDDTVQVMAGTYVENITLKNGVSLIGEGADFCIIDGNYKGSVVTSRGCDPNTILDGFALIKGRGAKNYINYSIGGGVSNFRYSNPTIKNCVIKWNAARYGGGICNYEYCNPKIIDCKVINNSADWGGGIYNYRSNSEITNCNIINNTSLGGGGMANYSSSPRVVNAIFWKNSAEFEGAGMSNDSSEPMIINCTFTGNVSFDRGRGGGLSNSDNSKATLVNCILWGNVAYDDGPETSHEIYNSNTSTALISNSNIAGCGKPYNWNTSLGTDGGGNIDSDPLFKDVDGAIYLSEREDYIKIKGYKGITGGGSRTCTAWVNIYYARWWNDIIGWGKMEPGQRWLITISEEGKLQLAAYDGYQRGNTSIDDGQWHHIAVVLDSDGTPNTSEISIFIDGIEETSYTTKSQSINTQVGKDVQIGLYDYDDIPSRYYNRFTGRIGDVRIYDRALTQSEIQQIMAQTDSETKENLEAHWPLIGNANDTSGNNRHGTPNNIPVWTMESYNGEYDLSLKPCSQCINAGDNRAVSDDITTDLGGNPRVIESQVDMGAYEFVVVNDTEVWVNNDYVPGGENDGHVWGKDAFNSIQEALCSVGYGSIVYVAAGTYYENFTLKNGIAVMGEDPNTTIIDGMRRDNSSIVISIECDPNTLLEGFTLANGNGVYINNSWCGGGMLNIGSTMTVKNCIFTDNIAWAGGGMCNFFSNLTVVNCLFYGHNVEHGAGMANIESNPMLLNCTFTNNSAGYGGAIENWNSSPLIKNCIFWDNFGYRGNDIFNGCYNPDNSCAPIISFSNVFACGGSGSDWNDNIGIDGGGNTDVDPLFVNSIDKNFRLSEKSPCIDGGDPSFIPLPDETDLDGHMRFMGLAVDIGCYEFLSPIEAEAKLTPQVLNRKSKQPYVMGRLELAGISAAELDPNEPMVLMPGNIAAERVEILPGKQGTESITLVGFFDPAALMEAIDSNPSGLTATSPSQGRSFEVTLAAKLLTGQWVYGTDIVRIQ